MRAPAGEPEGARPASDEIVHRLWRCGEGGAAATPRRMRWTWDARCMTGGASDAEVRLRPPPAWSPVSSLVCFCITCQAFFLSERKPASAPCAAPASRTARPPQRASQKRPPHPHRPKARARLCPTKSPCRTRTSPLSALPHAPPHPAAARTSVCPTASTPSRAAPVHRRAPAGPPPAESTHQAARPQRPERLETSFPRAFHIVFHIFAGFPQRLSFPLAFFERDRVRYALPYVPAVR